MKMAPDLPAYWMNVNGIQPSIQNAKMNALKALGSMQIFGLPLMQSLAMGAFLLRLTFACCFLILHYTWEPCMLPAVHLAVEGSKEVGAALFKEIVEDPFQPMEDPIAPAAENPLRHLGKECRQQIVSSLESCKGIRQVQRNRATLLQHCGIDSGLG